MLIGVAGMVGAGKTTLTRALAARFGLQLALESVDDDNPWLELFYRDTESRRQYALELQLHFLAMRFAAMRRMRAQGGSWILDRTWYEDAEVFARGLYERGLMSRVEHDLYVRLYVELLHAPAARPPLTRDRLPEFLLRDHRFETRAHAVDDDVERCGIAHEIVIAHVDAEHRAVAEIADPLLVAIVQNRPVLGLRFSLGWTASHADAAEENVERTMQIDE